MKAALVLCVMGALLAAAQAQGRGCIYVEGHCMESCKEGTHSYTPGCGPVLSERTCSEPVSRAGRGIMCDYTRCECDAPTVKDEASGKCVLLADCPDPER